MKARKHTKANVLETEEFPYPAAFSDDDVAKKRLRLAAKGAGARLFASKHATKAAKLAVPLKPFKTHERLPSRDQSSSGDTSDSSASAPIRTQTAARLDIADEEKSDAYAHERLAVAEEPPPNANKIVNRQKSKPQGERRKTPKSEQKVAERPNEIVARLRAQLAAKNRNEKAMKDMKHNDKRDKASCAPDAFNACGGKAAVAKAASTRIAMLNGKAVPKAVDVRKSVPGGGRRPPSVGKNAAKAAKAHNDKKERTPEQKRAKNAKRKAQRLSAKKKLDGSGLTGVFLPARPGQQAIGILSSYAPALVFDAGFDDSSSQRCLDRGKLRGLEGYRPLSPRRSSLNAAQHLCKAGDPHQPGIDDRDDEVYAKATFGDGGCPKWSEQLSATFTGQATKCHCLAGNLFVCGTRHKVPVLSAAVVYAEEQECSVGGRCVRCSFFRSDV